MKDLAKLKERLNDIVGKTFASFIALMNALATFLKEVDPEDSKDLSERVRWVEDQLDISERALIECGNEILSINRDFWVEFSEKQQKLNEKKKEILSCISLINASFSKITSMLSAVLDMRESTRKFKERFESRNK